MKSKTLRRTEATRADIVWLALVASVLMLITLTGCTKRSCGDGRSQVYCGAHADDMKSIDPAQAYDAISWDVIPQIYEALYQYSYLSSPYQLEPLLADGMPKFSKDELTVTVAIKKGVKFADDPAFKSTQGKGRELTARDFILQIKRMAHPVIQSPGWPFLEGKIVGINAFADKLKKAPREQLWATLLKEEISGLKALDDHTLEIKLTKKYPQLLYVLAMPFISAVAQEAVETYQDKDGNLVDKAVGTGPFRLAEWKRGNKITLERNLSFRGEPYPKDAAPEFLSQGLTADSGKPMPFLDRVELNVIKEQQPAWLKFLNFELDRMGIPKDNFSQAMMNQKELSPDLQKKDIRLSVEQGMVFFYVSFNMKDKIVGTNKALRQAISSVLNRDRFIELFSNNRWIKASSALPPGVPGKPENQKLKYDYNIAKAKELLVKAGYPEGKGLPVLNFDMRGASSEQRQMGDFLTQAFAEAGMRLNVIYNTFPAYLEKAKQGNLQISMGGWGMDYPDPENAFQLLYGPNKAPGPNEANYDSAEFNKMYEQMAAMQPGVERTKLIQKMEDHIQEETPWALMYYRTTYSLTQGWLKNFRSSELILNQYKYYRIDNEQKKATTTR